MNFIFTGDPGLPNDLIKFYPMNDDADDLYLEKGDAAFAFS